MIIPTKIYDGVSGGAVDLSANGSVHALDITGKIPAGSTITEIRYYVSGGDGASVTFQELCLVASQKQGDTSLTENTKTNFSLPGYTVLIVEHMGGDGTLFYVDAVIGGEEYSDESIHQLKAKMMDGFILYVPDSAWENGVKASRGDIVTVGWANNAYVFLYDNVTPTYAGSRLFDNNGHYSIKFYENPTEDGVVKQFTSDATTSIGDVNATVQMFNYDKNINQSGNPLQFWNGYWGYAAEVESEDGSGIEDDTYRYPYVKTTLGEDGYPAFHPYVVDPNGAYYKTSGSQFLLAEKADVYKNVDFSKTFDANGAENGKGTYYKDSSGNLVPVADAGKYAQVDFSTKYSVDTTQDISLGYLFGAGVDGSKYGAAQSNGVTAYAPMNNGGGLFRHDPHTGNYFYYSMQNAAYFDPDANGGKGGFTLYDSLIVRPWYNSVGGDDYDRNVDNFNYDAYIKAGYTAGATVADPESYGNFLPFNKVTENNITLDGAVYTYDAGGNRVVSTTDYSATVQAAAIGGTLEKYGLSTAAAQKVLAANKSMGSGAVDIIQKDYQYSTGLHTARLEDDVDMWFGMTVDFNFFQPYGGQTKTATGEINDMVFDFEGDDDVFVYVGLWDDAAQAYDYRLVLDIGGIHEARKGLINFASGAVEYKNCYGENVKTTLGEIFDLDKDTFEDFSRLSLKFFYMERGGNISCCCLRFNLPTLPEDSLTVSKALDTAVLGSQSYQFRVLEAKYDALSGTVVATDKPVITAESLIGTSNDGFVDENGYFTLTPGQSVTFEDIAGIFKDVQYYVVEETIHSADADGQYHSYSPTCTLNGTSVTVQPVSEADGVYVYRSEPMKLNISTRSENARSATTNLIGFTNHVEESKLGVLRITKKIKEGANISADSVFDVRVKLGGAPLPVGTAYKLYNVDLSAYELKYVTEKGIVSLKAEQTVVIERILSTSTVEVTELAHNASPSYATNTPTAITCAQNGAFGTMPLGGDVTITITNDDGTGLMVDKTVAKGDADDKFNLTLEAFGTGETSSFVSTKPADIVLVLDQSASMYTPKGASKDRFDKWAEQRYTAGLEPLEAGSLDPEKAKHTGYYVAQPKAYNQQLRESEEGVDYDGDGQIEAEARIYDWMIVQYAEYNGQWGWYYIRVEDTTTPVSFDFANATLYDHDSLNQYGMTLYASDDRGLSSDFIYFQSQYGSLYDSVNDFVTDLNAQASANKVNHRVAIVGFSGPYYDAMNYYNGTGIYIDGSYYLYDNDYMHKGKYVDGVLVQDNVNGTVILDPDAGYKQWPFKPVAADKSEYDFVGIVEGNENRYASAFVDISTEAGLQSVAASINAIKTNYMQTCPAIGIRIARSIFKGEEIKLNDPGLANSSTTAAQLINAANPGAVPVSDRDQIIILFTDGVPTVSMYSDHDDAISKNAEIYNEYWTGNAGVRDAINEANAAKSEGVKIYTIGTAAASKKYGNLGDAKDANTSAGDNRIPFLDLVSSNYPEASSVYDVVPVSGDNMGVSAYNFTVDYGTKAEDADFALSASQNSDLTVVFGTIMESITLPTVKLDGNAVLKEYLSDYFDLDAVDTGEIQVYVAPYAGVNDKGEHTFGDRVLASEKGFTIEVTFDSYGGRNDVVVNVKGFNYSQNYVRQDPDTQELLGYKLIVVVPIKARDGFWGGNNVPTNKDITAIYDDKGNEVQDFPMPEVNVPMQPVVTTQDQVIYYGDSTIGPEDILTGVTVDGYAVKYDPTLGKFVPGDLTSDADDWMDDYAVLKWSAGSSTMDTPVSSVTSKDYTFGVTLTPLPGHAGRENLSINGSNIAGDPVPMTGTSDHSTGHVDILVPVLTFQDSTIEIGDVTDKAYYDTTNYVDTIIWVNMENPYDGNGEPIEASPSDPDAAEPVLTVTYSPTADVESYFMTDTPVNVTVYNGNVDLTKEAYFHWERCESELHNEEDIANHKGDAESYEFWIHVKAVSVLQDSVVIDFGIPVDIDVLKNDILYGHGTVVGMLYGDLPAERFTDTLDSDVYQAIVNAAQNHGGLTITEDGKIRYLSNDMQMPAGEKFVYVVKYQNGAAELYYYSTVTIIPATIIYYEDNFVDLSVEGSDTSSGWSDVYTNSEITEFPDVVQSEDRIGSGNRYGYDAAYGNMSVYSLGAAKHINVNANRTGKATFDFRGTGFDVISLTSDDTGMVLVRVYQLDEEGNPVDSKPEDGADIDSYKAYLVDTYYGYLFGDHDQDPATADQWYVDADADNALYQVPVIKVEGLPYGSYQVVISASYGSIFDHNKTDDSYDFYLDAIRIYNPAGDANAEDAQKQPAEDIKNAYLEDGEYAPTFEQLRDLIIRTGDFNTEADVTDGVIFIDGINQNASISDYTNYGPNNELYLASGQAVAFVLNKHSAQQVHMAMKSVGGTAKVKIYAAGAGVNVDDLESLEIATAMDLYYDLTDYKDGSTVVIVNSGTEDDAILSITNVKTTYGESDSGEQTRDYTMNPSAAAIVLKTLGAVQAAAPTLTPSYPTVAFEDEICYNIYFDLENGDGLTVNDMGLMSWYSKPENIRYEDAEYVVSGVSFNESAGKYVARSQGIPAKNLADDLYFVVYAKLSDGSYVYSELYRYNAKAYAEDILANSTNQKMKALCVAMLNYGAEAQVYFDHNTDSLMNADLTAEQQALVSDYRTDMIDALIPVDNTKAEQFNSNFGGYSDAYPSVSFLGAFSINFYFVPANTPDSGMTFYYWDEATYESVDILTVENATGVVELTEADGLYAASCEDISAKQIDETVFVCGVYESNGVRYSTGVLNYSIGAYCLDRIANGNADMQAFAEATAVYGYYAKSYFNIV